MMGSFRCLPGSDGAETELGGGVLVLVADEVCVLLLVVNGWRVQCQCQCRVPALAWSPWPILSALDAN